MQASGSCQDDEGFQCGAGQFPCLPHWKFDDDLKYVIGSGAVSVKQQKRRVDVMLKQITLGDHGDEVGCCTTDISFWNVGSLISTHD